MTSVEQDGPQGVGVLCQDKANMQSVDENHHLPKIAIFGNCTKTGTSPSSYTS